MLASMMDDPEPALGAKHSHTLALLDAGVSHGLLQEDTYGPCPPDLGGSSRSPPPAPHGAAVLVRRWSASAKNVSHDVPALELLRRVAMVDNQERGINMAPNNRHSVHSDEVLLHYLGYRQVLQRKMGTFSNFAISFSIISVVAAGCVTTYYQALNNGGPVAIVWGWVLVSVFTTLVAMAMAELASSLATAGGLSFWASKLGGPAWGWFTGWFNLVGQITVTAGIAYGSGVVTTALLNLLFPDLVDTESSTIFIVFTVIVALHVLLNLLDINILSALNSIGALWGMVGVGLIVLVLAIVPDHQPASFVFTETLNNSGFSGDGIGFWYIFGLGLLMSAWTITGYDASAHLSEETNNASRSVARGMVSAVVVSGIFGFFLLAMMVLRPEGFIPSSRRRLELRGAVALGGGPRRGGGLGAHVRRTS
jgi:amino acid permease